METKLEYKFISGYVICSECAAPVYFRSYTAMNIAMAIKFKCINCLSLNGD